jgi:murein DD-endopeptidase MepM/ murein hydrolase activator NlpD
LLRLLDAAGALPRRREQLANAVAIVSTLLPRKEHGAREGGMMHKQTLQLFFLLVTATSAAACPFITDDVSQIPKLIPPTNSAVTSGFGMRLHPILQVSKFHTGIDYEAAMGDPIHAAARGRVVVAKRQGDYGGLVVIKHGGGLETAYAHLSRIDAKKGDCVDKGEPIGLAGATGIAVGPKLHFEVKQHGQFVDPLSIVKNAKP